MGGAERNWDLLVHAFGEECPWSNEEGVEVIHATGLEAVGPKWRAMHSLFERRKDYFLSYDYVCFPDDDLAANVETVNAIFVVAQHFGLDLAQPALTHDSHILCWGITMENRSFLLRYTSFVEVMTPVFSQSFLQRCAPSFNENVSGYGLDLLWSNWITSPLKMGILDICPVKHTRAARTGPLYKTMAAMGANPDEELIELIKKYQLIPERDQVPGRVVMPQPRVWGGILRNQSHSRITVQEGHGTALLRALLNGFPDELAMNRHQVVNMLYPIMQQMVAQ